MSSRATPRKGFGVVGFVDGLLESSGDGPVAWRSMALLFVAAGVITLGGIVWGVDPRADEQLIAGLGTAALLFGVAVLPFARRLPERLVFPALLLGLALVSAAVLASHQVASPYLFFYVWVGAEAWFFLRSFEAISLTLLTIALSGAVIWAVPGTHVDAGAWWLMTVGSLLAVSFLAGVLHGRAQRSIERLAEVATRDELTGLLNRRGYRQRLVEELARAARYQAPLSILLGDLDEFKTLNDRFGHRHGDRALQQFADICRDHLRDHIDFVSRVGGEEFAIVLPQTSESEAILAAERIRRAVNELLRAPDGTPVTASFGVATYPSHGVSPEMLLDHADQAMYAAKGLGRNRTVAFGDNLPRADAPTGEQEHMQAVVLLAETLDLRDAGTRAHSETVACLSRQIATAMGLAPAHVERVRLAGLLHDVGKIGVPDHVLRKPGRLEPDEWSEMRKHPELGARIVEGSGLRDIAAWVLAHHERPDGAGYPHGLPGDRIPMEARILGVADAYEAMTADRPYRKGIGRDAAIAELRRHAGTQFDADVVDALIGGLSGPDSDPTSGEMSST